MAYRIHDGLHVLGKMLRYLDGNAQRLASAFRCAILFAQCHDHLFKGDPVRHFSSPGRQYQQRRADHGLGVLACIFQSGSVHPQLCCEPDGRVNHLNHLTALGPFGLVVGKAPERPFGKLRNMVVGEAGVLVHAEMAVLRHGDQGLEHVRAAFGARQQGMVAQRFSRLPQITVAAGFKIKAHQIDHALFGFFKLGAQEFASEVACNLHHAFRRFGANQGQFLRVDDAVLYAVLKRFFKKRARVIQGDSDRRRVHRHKTRNLLQKNTTRARSPILRPNHAWRAWRCRGRYRPSRPCRHRHQAPRRLRGSHHARWPWHAAPSTSQ